MKTKVGKHCLGTVCGLGLTVASLTAIAQPDTPSVEQPKKSRAVLEEVLVTATLREESLQNVPVSVNAVGGEKLFEAGIDKVEDLESYVPNLDMSETGIGTNIYIRGIGSGINPGFEQSVGLYFDGVSYGRAQLTRAPFLDLARVEVLRGPQNILFGKNSIAGALSLHSAKPTQQFEGKASALYEPQHGETVFDLVLSGPLTDDLGARLAIRKRDIDGYIENLTLDRDEPERDEATVRLIFDWAATDNVQALLKLEAGQFDVVGRQVEIISAQPADTTPDGEEAPFPGKTYGEILNNQQGPFGGALININEDSSVLNEDLDFKRSANGDFSNNDTYNVTLNVDWFRDGHEFTFITGLLAYEFEELCDCDFTGARVFKVAQEEEYQQYSQEFRWVSPPGETFDFIGGGFVQYSELTFFDSIRVTSDVLPQLVNAADVQEGGARGDAPEDGDSQGGFGPLPGSGVGDAGNHLRGLRSPRDFTTDSLIASAFMQVTWNFTPSFRGIFGGRISWEKKEGSRKLEFINQSDEPDTEQETKTVVAKNFSAEEHDLEGDFTSTQFAPSVTLQWDMSQEIMAYATASQGFKTGGYDARSNQSPADNDPAPHNPNYGDDRNERLRGSFKFDEEEARSLELGAKSTWLGGAAELNVAAFFTQYDDLQISIFDGTLGFNVGNAGKAETYGLELDGRLALTENLMLTGALALLDFEFTDFENGQCNHVQIKSGKDPDGDGLCDFTGETNQYVADYSGSLSLAYNRPIGKSLEFRAVTDVTFTDEYHPTQNLDPTQIQEGYYKLNARLSIADVVDGWEVAIVGKNLNDQEVVTYANDAPLAFSSLGAVTHYGFIARPLSIAVQGIYKW